MDYLLFTYPNCSQCEAVKGYLTETPLAGEEYSLVLKESKMKIRDYLGVLKRDESSLPDHALAYAEDVHPHLKLSCAVLASHSLITSSHAGAEGGSRTLNWCASKDCARGRDWRV